MGPLRRFQLTPHNAYFRLMLRLCRPKESSASLDPCLSENAPIREAARHATSDCDLHALKRELRTGQSIFFSLVYICDRYRPENGSSSTGILGVTHW
jgi:hypothetical protein